MAESISYIRLGDQEHPIDAVTVNGLSFTSEEKTRWDNKQDALTFDSIPTENSDNPVKSGGVYDMIVDNEYVISTALNDLNDRMLDVEEGMSGVLVSETDPVFSASPAASITAANISSWNSKLSGVTFNGVSASVSGGTASISVNIPDNVLLIELGYSYVYGTEQTLPSGTSNTINQAVQNGKIPQIRVIGMEPEYLDDFVYQNGYTEGSSNYNFDFVNVRSNQILRISDNDHIEVIDDIFIPAYYPAASITASDISSWNAKQNALTFDSIPTENSDNLVKSGPLYTVLTNTELVVATALNDLNERIINVNSSISEVYDEIDRALTAVLTYRGTVGSNGDVSVLPSSHEVGDVYVVSVAGTYAGQACEVGDYIICKTSGTSASDGDWNVINGENQVSNSAATLAEAGSNVTIATVDGTNITISTPSSWTGVSKNGTLTGVTLNGVSASVSNGVAQLNLVFDSIPTENSDNLVKSGDLYTVIVDNEEVTAAALNDLNDRLLAVESVSTTHISGITFNGVSASVSNGVARISATIPAYFVINGDNYSYTSSSDYEAYVDFGNIVTAVSFNGTNVSLSNGRVSMSETDPVFMSSPAASITAANISAWNAKQDALTFDSIPTQNSDNLVKSGVLYSVITDNELVVSTALNDLNDRVSDLESNTGSGGITGVMFNGVSASISNGVASISASIPTEVTEATVSGWGFTKNTGTLTTHASHKLTTTNGTATSVNQGTEITFIESLTGTTTATSGDLTVTATRKKVAIPTAVTESSVTGWGFTKNTGTLTGVKLNGVDASVSNGVASINARIPSYIAMNGNAYTYTESSDYEAFFDIGDVVTAVSFNGTNVSLSNGSVSMSETDPVFSASAAASISAADITNWNSKTSNTGTLTGVKFNGTNASISNGVASISVTIPAAITESDVAGWGFTKNTGTLTSESDPVFSASVASSITAADITNWNSKTSNTGTITGISMNGSSKGTSGNVNLGTVVTGLSMNGSAVTVSNGVANLGTVLTSHQSIKTINSQTMTGSGNVTIREIPACTSSDNGKILQVVNGQWTLVTPVSIYSGTSNPDNTQGTNGDLYLQTS